MMVEMAEKVNKVKKENNISMVMVTIIMVKDIIPIGTVMEMEKKKDKHVETVKAMVGLMVKLIVEDRAEEKVEPMVKAMAMVMEF